MSQRRTAALLASLVLATGLVACGGDDGGDDGSDDVDQITEVIEQTTTTTDPAHCTELETQAFVEQTEFATGEEAIQRCGDENAGDNADSVEVSEVEVDGDAATASVAFEGSIFDSQTLVLGLVKDGDQWKLDSIDDIVDIDFEALSAALAADAEAAGDEEFAAIAPCIEDYLTGAQAPSPDAVTAAILSGDSQQVVDVVFGGCAP